MILSDKGTSFSPVYDYPYNRITVTNRIKANIQHGLKKATSHWELCLLSLFKINLGNILKVTYGSFILKGRNKSLHKEIWESESKLVCSTLKKQTNKLKPQTHRR